MKGSSLEAIPVLLELSGHWFSFPLPYNTVSPNIKIRGRGRNLVLTRH